MDADGWAAPLALEEVIKDFDRFTEEYMTLEEYGKQFDTEDCEENPMPYEESANLDISNEKPKEKICNLLQSTPGVFSSDTNIDNIKKIEYASSKLIPPILKDEIPILMKNTFFVTKTNAHNEQNSTDNELDELKSFIFGSKSDKYNQENKGKNVK